MKRRNDSASKPNLSNIEGALAALNAEDLRNLIRAVIPRLDDKDISWFTSAIVERASRGRAEWRPSEPTDEGVAEVLAFAEAVKRTGYADPTKIDDHLQEGRNAFLARNYRAAIRIFHALLIPLSEGEIDIGRDEMFEEALGVNTVDCAARYAVAVYMTSAPDQRARAVFTAIEDMREVGTFLDPLQEIERVAVEPLPDFDVFLPQWRALMDEPCLPNPSVDEIMALAGLEDVKSDAERAGLIQAMQEAALKRIEGVAENKRRRYYGHAAYLAAACAAVDKSRGMSEWIAEIRSRYRRLPALQRELDRCLI
jgi:hypothetical protein